MRSLSFVILFIGIAVLLYGLVNCNCNKENFINSTRIPNYSGKNYENITQIISKEMTKIDQITKKNKDLLTKTQQIANQMKKTQTTST